MSHLKQISKYGFQALKNLKVDVLEILQLSLVIVRQDELDVLIDDHPGQGPLVGMDDVDCAGIRILDHQRDVLFAQRVLVVL